MIQAKNLRTQFSEQKIVFTNGCFDILHIGHLRYLAEAKSKGDILVVGLNSDSSVKRLKGESRPICNEAERSEMLLGLKPIDHVFIFEEDTPEELIKIIKPDVLCKGGDWRKEEIVGSSFLESYGGEVLSLRFESGHSTTDIIDRIQGRA